LDTVPVRSPTTPGTSELRPWLTAIADLIAAVNAGGGLTSLLDLATATARDLLELSFCAVMLPAADGASLMIAGSSGLPAEYIARVNEERRIRLEPDASTGAPASRAFRSGRPSSVVDVAAQPMSTWTGVAREQGYRSILAVPLVVGGEVVGTLNSYRERPHEFSPEETARLELLAELAAIALTSARFVDDLREQHRLSVRSEEIHERLVRVAVRSGGVAGIATALHDLLGCEVVVRDTAGETLAAAPGSPTSAELPAPQSRLEGPRDLVRVEGPHVVVDVVLDGSVVAFVWLVGLAGRLDPLGVRAAEHASLVLALELLRQRTAAEVEQALRGELLADLLAGAAVPAVRDRAHRMGHDLAVPHRTIVARARGPVPAPTGRSREELAQRAAAEAVRMTRRLRPRPLIASVRDTVVALWPDGLVAPAADEVLRRAVAQTHAGGDAALAESPPDDAGFPAAYRTARGALALADDGGSADLLRLEDLGVAGLLLQFAEPAALRRYAERTLGALRRYDAEHGAELVRTLRVHLDAGLDRRVTGEQLVVHPNTVSQRLRRIEVLTGLSLRSSRAVLEARTALLLLDVVEAADVPVSS
jgi:GAF domain-containing protein/sugar diacid utilization regulator